jgi:serine/threonine-protein kinase SRPK3
MLVSLKILTADASRSSSDARILRHLHPEPGWVGYFLNRTYPGEAFVLAMLDDFEIRGPNGIHRCIVAEVLGPSINDVGSFGDARLPLPVARKLAVQFAKGLAYIHSRGVIHGGIYVHAPRK